MVRALIFDFDGLLFNTEPTWNKAYLEFIKVKGIRDQDFGDTTGMGLVDFIKLLKEHGLLGETPQLASEYREIFYRLFSKENDVLMPGALQILSKARGSGLTISLTSGGHTRKKLLEMLRQKGILDYFSVIISSDEVSRGKPAPDVYLEAVYELDLPAGGCIALEDSVNGVKSAVSADIKAIGVNSNKVIRDDLIKAGAVNVYSSLFEVKL